MMPRRHPRVPSIGLASRHSCAAASRRRPSASSSPLASWMRSSSTSGRNSCSGGSSRRMVTGRPSIASKMPSKSERWSFSSSASASSSSTGLSARMNRCTSGSRSPRNMCSVRQRPMPSAPYATRHLRRRAGRSALVRTRIRRNVSAQREDGLERTARVGRDDRNRADHDLTGRAVDRDDLALAHGLAVDLEEAADDVDLQLVGTAHRGRAHAARHDGGVAHEPAARREDALGRDHAVQVVGRRLRPHEDDVFAELAVVLGEVGGEVDPTDGRAGRRVEALGDRGVLGLGVELRVQQLVELRRLHAQHRLALVDEALFLHLDGHAQRGRGGALADARLQQEQATLLDGELDVAHVAVVALQRLHQLEQLLCGTRGTRCPSRRAARWCGCRRRRLRPARSSGSRRRRRSRRSRGCG